MVDASYLCGKRFGARLLVEVTMTGPGGHCPGGDTSADRALPQEGDPADPDLSGADRCRFAPRHSQGYASPRGVALGNTIASRCGIL